MTTRAGRDLPFLDDRRPRRRSVVRDELHVRLTVICVGRLSREYLAVADHYARLLRPYATVEVREVAEVPISHGSGEGVGRRG